MFSVGAALLITEYVSCIFGDVFFKFFCWCMFPSILLINIYKWFSRQMNLFISSQYHWTIWIRLHLWALTDTTVICSMTYLSCFLTYILQLIPVITFHESIVMLFLHYINGAQGIYGIYIYHIKDSVGYTLPWQWSLLTISQENHSFHPLFSTDVMKHAIVIVSPLHRSVCIVRLILYSYFMNK